MVQLTETENPEWDESSYEEVTAEVTGLEENTPTPSPPAEAAAAASEEGLLAEKMAAVAVNNSDKPKGKDSIYRAKVSLEDFYHGKPLQLQIERTKCVLDDLKVDCKPCRGTGCVLETRQSPTTGELVASEQKCVVCHGEGFQTQGPPKWQVKTVKEKVDVEVRPGTRNGTKVLIAGMGDECLDKSAGDLQVILEEKPHPIFKRKNENDLVATKEVSSEEATNGIEWTLTHLDQTELTVRAEAKDIIYSQGGGHVIRKIPNMGMPSLDKPSLKGNLEVVFQVQPPLKSEEEPKKSNAVFGAVKSFGVGISSAAVDKGLGMAAIGVSAASALSSVFGDSAIAQCNKYDPTENPKVFVTPSFGGSGGSACDHGCHQPRLERLVIYGDNHVVRAIDVFYHGKPMMSIGQCTEGATPTTMTLAEDEYICFIKVRSNRYVQEVTFGTNRGNTVGPCGGRGWRPMLGKDTVGYETLVLGDPSLRLSGFKCTVGRRMDSIAFYLENIGN